MDKRYHLALHIFRRDLRLQDNNALIEALKASEKVIPCFIFDPKQLGANEYKGDHSIQFMAKSLQELAETLHKKQAKLYFFYGRPEKIVEKLLQTLPINAVYFNRDYTPFSKARDAAIKACCLKNQVDLHVYADALLHEPEAILKSDDTPYTIFTPFMKRARQYQISATRKNTYSNFYQGKIAFEDKQTLTKLLQKQNPNLLVKGGRQEGLTLLKHIKQLKNYNEARNWPAIKGTSHLSSHNKFGTISIREFAAAIKHYFGPNHTLMNELYWRDFFTHIAYHYPNVFGHPFQAKYAALAWRNNKKYFHAWCHGMTGFPIVDAGMRELNATGYMHNRVRMIVASFLTKDLHINWLWGEKYFAQQLIDYDPAVNNGNWQWAASTGCDAQPYFRIFNPWLQQKKFDPDCLYIKKWLPELAKLTPKEIHGLEKNTPPKMNHYPKPMINHGVESRKALLIFKHATRR